MRRGGRRDVRDKHVSLRSGPDQSEGRQGSRAEPGLRVQRWQIYCMSIIALSFLLLQLNIFVSLSKCLNQTLGILKVTTAYYGKWQLDGAELQFLRSAATVTALHDRRLMPKFLQLVQLIIFLERGIAIQTTICIFLWRLALTGWCYIAREQSRKTTCHPGMKNSPCMYALILSGYGSCTSISSLGMDSSVLFLAIKHDHPGPLVEHPCVGRASIVLGTLLINCVNDTCTYSTD